MKTFRFDGIALFLAVLAGCGASISFKRGAAPDAMSADERACRDASSGDAGYLQCMRSRGWTVIETGGQNAARAEATSVPAAPAAPPRDAAPAATSFTPTPTVAIPAVSHPIATAIPSPPAQPATPTAEAAASSPALGGLIPAQPSDPLAKVSVASWWRLGGTADDLDRAIAACVAELGPAHQPAPNATEVTGAMRACLRKAGWFAVGNFNAR